MSLYPKILIFSALAFLGTFLSFCSSSDEERSSLNGKTDCIQGYSDQHFYEDIFDHAVWRVYVSNDLRFKGFDKVNSYFATIRYHIQKFQKKPIQKGKLEDFGLKRLIELSTPLSASGPYAGAYLRISEKIDENRKIPSSGPSFSRILDSNGTYTDFYAILAKNPFDSSETLVLSKFQDLRTSKGSIELFHTSPQYLDSAMDIVKKKHAQIIAMKESSESRSHILEAIGEFHWWYAQATPFVRGSASIGKMHVSSLLRFHQINGIGIEDILRFQTNQGIDLDVWALSSIDPNLYASLFAQGLKARYKVPIE